jgi:GPH family glycoside/pentoside/hexuronide:cation symporter
MSEKIIIRTYTSTDKLLWSLASLGGALISGVYAALLLYFYQVYLSLDAFFIAIAAGIYAIWNAINDPLFGYISDSKSYKKLGRRIPYMRFSAPLLGFWFILIWFVPVTWNQIFIFLWMLITMLLYDTGYTIVFLMYSALLPEITESDRERGELQKYSSIFYLIGTIMGFLIPDILRPKVGQVSLIPLYIGVVIIGIFGTICILITTYKFKERPEFTQIDKPLGLADSIKYTFKSKSFLILTSANFMSIFMQQVLLSMTFYLADYVLKVPTIFLLIAIFLGLLIGTVFANIFAGKLGVVKANQMLLIISAISLIMLPFIPDALIYISLFFAGFGISGPLVLTNVLFAQVADEDETKSGVRREASFFGINAFITKPAQSLSLALAPVLLQMSGFLTPGPGGEIIINQPESAIFMIKIVVGLLPGIALLIGAIILFWYPLKGEYLKEIQEKVLTMHTEKHAKLMERGSKT